MMFKKIHFLPLAYQRNFLLLNVKITYSTKANVFCLGTGYWVQSSMSICKQKYKN